MAKETKEVLANRVVSEYKSRPFRFNGSKRRESWHSSGIR